MKKITKRIILTSSIILSIVIIFSGWFYLKMKSETGKMHPAQTQAIIPGNLFCIKDGFCNIYILKNDNGYLVFDAGNDIETIKNELIKLKIDPEKVTTLFLTHTDRDHVASIPVFKNAAIYLSKDEEQMINGKKSRILFFGNSIGHVPYKTVSDGDTVYINNIMVKCILTPGHTPGSMCYLLNGKYLITGDALALENGKVIGFSDFANMDTKTALKSIEKLKNLTGVEIICTAHSGFTTYSGAF